MIKRAATVVVLGGALLPHGMMAQARSHPVVFVVSSADMGDWDTAKGAPTSASTASLEAKGVHFVASENAMRAHQIPRTDLLPGVTSVPSGVVELVEKQEKGWAYVKVGQ